MKKSNIYVVLLISFVALIYSCGPTPEQARQFNDDVIEQQKAVMVAINELEAANSTFDPQQIEPKLAAAAKQIDESLAILKKMKNIDEETDFFPLTIELIEMFKAQVDNEYKKILEQYKLSDEEYSEETTNAILKSIDDAYNPLAEKFFASQQKFADKYGFELEETE
ncbi:MAG: hypothetical protein P1P88_08640 [Bacteroidales bacterium]|nr:hypothetical protein [Bacteroidales bacterium]